MKVLAATNMYPSGANPKAGTFIEQQILGLRRIGVHVDVVLVDRANRGASAYGMTRSEVRRAVHERSPDIVHVMYGGVFADLATRSCQGLPVVVSFCGVDLLGAKYGSVFYILRTWIGRRRSIRAARRAHAIIVKSNNLRDGLPSGIDPRIVAVLPNGVDLERFRPLDRLECQEKLGWESGVFHILFSTTDPKDPKKRLRLAERAVDTLNGRGTRAEIHGLHHVPHEEVPVWLNAADVVLMTSRADEGSPNIIKEALACNRPVVSLDVGDVKERIEGIEGCHVAEADPGDLASKLQLVSRGPRAVESRERMGALSIETVARRLVAVYEAALGRKKDSL